MKLSIGMMVKNEDKYLKQCLESLQPIRDAIESELIIVDTGSTDNTVEIAKEFTDKVYFHQWNNNFSEMRNITIKYANGEWFFYIDGDEVVSNPEGLIEFFKYSEYKKNNAACVSIKNLNTSNIEEGFSVFLAPRLFKRDEDFHFEGAIHNQPKYKEPLIVLNSELLHYGYVTNDKELMEKKFQRTSIILKNELKTNPENIYYLFQLSVSYSMHEDIEDAFEPILKAYNLVKCKNLNLEHYMYVYTHLVKIYLAKGKYKEAEKICLEAITTDKHSIDLQFYLAKSQLNMCKNREAIESYREYLIKRDIKNNENISMIHYTLEKYEEAYLDLITLYEREEDYEAALEVAKKIQSNWFLEKAFDLIISIHIKSNKYDELREYYKEILVNHSKLKESFIMKLENNLCNFKKDKRENVYKVFSWDDSEYSLLNRIRLSEEVLEKGVMKWVEALDFNKLPEYYVDILYFLLCNNIPLEKFINKISDFKIKSYFGYLSNLKEDLGLKLYEYLKFYGDEKENIDAIRTNKILAFYILDSKLINDAQYKEVFDNYLKYGWHYLEKTYNNDIIQNDLVHCMKVEEDLFLMYMHIALKHKDDKVLYLKGLRNALNTCSYMKRGIEMLLEEEKSNFTKGDSFVKKDVEMEIYKKKVKETISELIDSNNIDKARVLIDEYEGIVKEDVEIYSMRAVIAILENRLEEAESILIGALNKAIDNFDLIYNLAYVYDQMGNKENSLYFYKKAVILAKDEALVKDINNKIQSYEKDRSGGTKEASIDIKAKNYFIKKEYGEILKYIQDLKNQRKFSEALSICLYWEETVNKTTAQIYYFMGGIYNSIGEFKLALTNHKRALELDGGFADIKNRKSVYKKKYHEGISTCIGCKCKDFHIVNVTNQSISEDNKEIINPIRIWVKCKDCGLIYSNPIPDESSLDIYYSIIAKEKFGGIYGDIDTRFEFLVSMANRRLEKIQSYNTGSESILDIGTGIGVFVGVAKDRGWRADGIELTHEDCNYAKDKYGIELIQKNFYDIGESVKYNVVTLFEVIEHLRTPLKDLRRINKLINKNGLLVVATPIQDSLYGRKTRENNVFWNVVTHLSYFTKDVLINYLHEAGFEVLEINSSPEGMGRMEFYCRKIKEI
jgi:glycosyltransferase involved in cell wall biosynthesis/2-polyprenyl-3-methyl-5-hydroxy-6-metoxy-1,4-benzoquinol methylase